MSMVERVARAIMQAYLKREGQGLIGVASQEELEAALNRAVEKRWQDVEDLARAAIEAMLEPDEAMIEAMNAAFAEWELDGYKGPLPSTIFRAAISAALSPAANETRA